MRTVAEIEASGKPEQAFSNGTEFYAWMDNWCTNCIHDAAFQRDESTEGCPLLLVALFSEPRITPTEWMEQPENYLGDQYHCIEYRDEDDGPGPEPQPVPDPPGQELLLPREPYEAARMLSAVPVEVHA